MIDLFHKMINPYASEVWGGAGNNAVFERVHLMFCKYIVGLKRFTDNCIIYRELGRFPINIMIKTNIIAYWGRIATNQNQNKQPSLLYNVLYQNHETNTFHSECIGTVEKVLNDCGMSDVWQSQGQNILNVRSKTGFRINLSRKQTVQ